MDGLKVVLVFNEELDNDIDVETDQDKTDKIKGNDTSFKFSFELDWLCENGVLFIFL